MPYTGAALEGFFRDFEQNSSSADIPAMVAQFADVFFAAGPQGAQAVCASDFALALPRRKQLFDSLGCRSTALAALHLIPLDARYAMAKTQWRMVFGHPRGGTEEVMADSTFIVDTAGDVYRIVFYLASQDIAAVLKERGIVERGIVPEPA